MGTGPDVDELARRTADRLATRHVGVVVAALSGGAAAIHGAGSAGPGAPPPGAGTRFEAGSVTKLLTALLLARRAAVGDVALDEPLRELLPAGTGVPSRAGREILLRQLASHTSGLPRLPRGLAWRSLRDFPALGRDPYRHCTAELLLGGLPGTRLHGVPGAGFRYSNLGAGLLGFALAHRAGTGYGELLDAEVLRPLGMVDSAVEPAADRLAQGHTRRGRPTPPWRMAALAGAGGLHTTAADLVTFARAQLAAAAGEPAAGLAAEIRASHGVEYRMNRWLDVRLGWFGQELHPRAGGHRFLWHNGRTGGFSSYLAVAPERDVAVVVLSNTARPLDGPAMELLRALLDAAR